MHGISAQKARSHRRQGANSWLRMQLLVADLGGEREDNYRDQSPRLAVNNS